MLAVAAVVVVVVVVIVVVCVCHSSPECVRTAKRRVCMNEFFVPNFVSIEMCVRLWNRAWAHCFYSWKVKLNDTNIHSKLTIHTHTITCIRREPNIYATYDNMYVVETIHIRDCVVRLCIQAFVLLYLCFTDFPLSICSFITFPLFVVHSFILSRFVCLSFFFINISV